MLSRESCEQWKALGYPQIGAEVEYYEMRDGDEFMRHAPAIPTLEGLLAFLRDKLPERIMIDVVRAWKIELIGWVVNRSAPDPLEALDAAGRAALEAQHD